MWFTAPVSFSLKDRIRSRLCALEVRPHSSCKQHRDLGHYGTGTSQIRTIVLGQRYIRNGFELRVQVVRSYSFYSAFYMEIYMTPLCRSQLTIEGHWVLFLYGHRNPWRSHSK